MYRLTQNYRTYRLSLQHELYLNESTHFFCIRRQHERDLKDKSYFLKKIFYFFFLLSLHLILIFFSLSHSSHVIFFFFTIFLVIFAFFIFFENKGVDEE